MGNASQPEVDAGDPKKRIENTVLLGDISWGKFEPAIRRWEQVLGRPAPAPTKPDGKDGAHRLSSAFTEWMMGLPEGWITSHGLSRNDELKMAGNGVVPQQAELALRILLEGVALPPAGGGSKLFATPNTMDTLPAREGEAYERVRNAGGRKNRLSSGNLREQVVHLLPQDDVMLPTPTVTDQREGKHLRSVAIENLANGKNRGISLNHLVETIGVDWQDGDTFTVTSEGLKKND